ncbi:MAG: hypothetical protein JNM93_11300 [Bacteriovoracaceae bacterium]|nr:hypothetical protein [Bacteriovoracaceae bacterium]
MMNPPTLRLVGDPEKCFIDLGIKDKSSVTQDQLHRLLNLIPDRFSPTLEQHFPFSQKFITDYAEGAELSQTLIYKKLLSLEFSDSFNFPRLEKLQKPIESTIQQKEQDYKIQLRSAFSETALQKPRLLAMQLDGFQKVVTFNSEYQPLPGVFSCNEAGLIMTLSSSLSTPPLDLKARSLMDVVTEILYTCEDLNQAKKILKKYPTLSYWEIKMAQGNQYLDFEPESKKIKLTEFPIKNKNSTLVYTPNLITIDLNLNEQKMKIASSAAMEAIQIENFWERPQSIKSKKRQTPPAGYQRLQQAFLSLRQSKLPEAFHDLQMAQLELKEAELLILNKLLFLWWQYLRLNEREALSLLLEEVKQLETIMLANYRDYLYLLKLRIYKQLALRTGELKWPENKILKATFEKEITMSEMEFKIHKKIFHHWPVL